MAARGPGGVQRLYVMYCGEARIPGHLAVVAGLQTSASRRCSATNCYL